MAAAFTFFLALLCFLQLALRTHAAALTTSIGANERLCFYADVDKAGEKIGVSTLRLFLYCLLELTWGATSLVLLCSAFAMRRITRETGQ